VLILLGAVAAGLAVGGATGLAAVLWCYRFDPRSGSSLN